jgi:pyruvyltransferase
MGFAMTIELGARIKGFTKLAISRKRWVPLFWSKNANWGDTLSPVLAEYISGKPARFEQARFVKKFLCIGSILQLADQWSVVWGSGLIAEAAVPSVRPDEIRAVRGPLTREVLRRHGLECPAVYGDPALLLPRFLPFTPQPEHQVGIVPHYTDKTHPWIQHCANQNVKIIDIESGISEFVRDVLSCETILSSSLHGLICADAYGIPSKQIELGHEVIGEGFKFRDYYSSLNLQPTKPIRPDILDDPISIAQECTLKKMDLDLDLLLGSCPFGQPR